MYRLTIQAVAAMCLFAACTPLDPGRSGEAGVEQQGDPALQDGEAGMLQDAALQPVPGVGAVETGLGSPCAGEGVLRCSPAGAGARQICSGGVWKASEACASGQICQAKDGAPPSCQTVAEVCKGSAGSAVCDGQGNLIVCNADGTVGSQTPCASARLCQLGLPAQRCAVCVPRTEYKCTGTLLEVCAPDGQSFVKQEVCATEALCNKVAGMCTSALCASDKFACDGNTLTQCNADGSAFKSRTPCPTGTICDGAGGDCNACEPGQKKCENDMVMTCNATGQGYMASACPGGNRCVGAGQCAACASNDDCSAMTQGCKVGVCSTSNSCTAQNAASGTPCTTAGAKPGTCSSGQCQCTPQCNGKQCGDDGCGGMCPSRCSLLQSCVNSQCVDCTTNLQCLGSLDGCKTGVCTAGACSTKNAPSTTRCSTNAGSGMCNNGTCAICTPSCPANSCGSDGCGGTCRCTGANQECRSGQCALKLYAPCSTPAGVSSECGATVTAHYGCFAIAGNPPFCVSAASPCPTGTVAFGGGSNPPCLVACTPSAFGGCPSPFSKCQPLYPDNPSGPAYCVR